MPSEASVAIAALLKRQELWGPPAHGTSVCRAFPHGSPGLGPQSRAPCSLQPPSQTGAQGPRDRTMGQHHPPHSPWTWLARARTPEQPLLPPPGHSGRLSRLLPDSAGSLAPVGSAGQPWVWAPPKPGRVWGTAGAAHGAPVGAHAWSVTWEAARRVGQQQVRKSLLEGTPLDSAQTLPGLLDSADRAGMVQSIKNPSLGRGSGRWGCVEGRLAPRQSRTPGRR